METLKYHGKKLKQVTDINEVKAHKHIYVTTTEPFLNGAVKKIERMLLRNESRDYVASMLEQKKLYVAASVKTAAV